MSRLQARFRAIESGDETDSPESHRSQYATRSVRRASGLVLVGLGLVMPGCNVRASLKLTIPLQSLICGPFLNPFLLPATRVDYSHARPAGPCRQLSTNSL